MQPTSHSSQLVFNQLYQIMSLTHAYFNLQCWQQYSEVVLLDYFSSSIYVQLRSARVLAIAHTCSL